MRAPLYEDLGPELQMAHVPANWAIRRSHTLSLACGLTTILQYPALDLRILERENINSATLLGFLGAEYVKPRCRRLRSVPAVEA